MGAEMTISDIIKSVISGEMAKRLSNVSKVIVPIKRVEIRKTEVLEMGSAPQDVAGRSQPGTRGRSSRRAAEEAPEAAPRRPPRKRSRRPRRPSE